MLKQGLAILLLLVLFNQSLLKIGVLVYWKANQAYIAKTLCENRNKPAMHCNGKCHLKKQIKQIDQEETSTGNKQAAPQVKLQKTEPYCHIYTNELAFDKLEQKCRTDKTFIPYLSNRYNFTFSYAKFNPPDNLTVCS